MYNEYIMKRNIRDIDAIVRITVGFYLAYFYYVADTPSKLQTLGLIFAGYLILTAVQGNSPIYRIFGIKITKK